MFIPWFDLNSKLTEDESKLFRAEIGFAVYRTYQISHVQGLFRTSCNSKTGIDIACANLVSQITAFLEVLDNFKTTFIRSFNLFQFLTL